MVGGRTAAACLTGSVAVWAAAVAVIHAGADARCPADALLPARTLLATTLLLAGAAVALLWERFLRRPSSAGRRICGAVAVLLAGAVALAPSANLGPADVNIGGLLLAVSGFLVSLAGLAVAVVAGAIMASERPGARTSAVALALGAWWTVLAVPTTAVIAWVALGVAC